MAELNTRFYSYPHWYLSKSNVFKGIFLVGMRAESCKSDLAFYWRVPINITCEIYHISWEVLRKGQKIRKCEFYLPLANFGTLKSIVCPYLLRKVRTQISVFIFSQYGMLLII